MYFMNRNRIKIKMNIPEKFMPFVSQNTFFSIHLDLPRLGDKCTGKLDCIMFDYSCRAIKRVLYLENSTCFQDLLCAVKSDHEK